MKDRFCFHPTGKFNIKLSEVLLGSLRLAAEKASFRELSNAYCSCPKKDSSQSGQSVFFFKTILHLAGPLAQVRHPRRVTFLQRLLLSHGRWERQIHRAQGTVGKSQPLAVLRDTEQGANSCVHRETRCWRGQEVKEGFLYSCILQGKNRFRFPSVFWVIQRQRAMRPGTLPSLCFVLFFPFSPTSTGHRGVGGYGEWGLQCQR